MGEIWGRWAPSMKVPPPAPIWASRSESAASKDARRAARSASATLSFRAASAIWKPALPRAPLASSIASARARSAVPAAGSSGGAASPLKSASMRRMMSADSHTTCSGPGPGSGSSLRPGSPAVALARSRPRSLTLGLALRPQRRRAPRRWPRSSLRARGRWAPSPGTTRACP